MSEQGEDECRVGPSAQLAWCPGQGCVREIVPPRPVVVSCRAIDGGPSGILLADHPPSLRVRAAGLRIEYETQAWQSAWIRTYSGQWRALVTFDLFSANSRTSVVGLTVLVKPEDLRLRD